jgi:hypothetical protein
MITLKDTRGERGGMGWVHCVYLHIKYLIFASPSSPSNIYKYICVPNIALIQKTASFCMDLCHAHNIDIIMH